jgi:hypothetical protein
MFYALDRSFAAQMVHRSWSVERGDVLIYVLNYPSHRPARFLLSELEAEIHQATVLSNRCPPLPPR